MSPSRFLTKITLFAVISLFLVGCGSSSDGSADSNEIDTLHIFFEDNWIVSYDTSTKRSREWFEFQAGENMIFPMNTDEDKQGYEYAAYVSAHLNNSGQREINLFNYVNGAVTTIAVTQSTVCGIYPKLVASPKSIEEDGNNVIATVNRPVIYIETVDGAKPCAPEDNLVFRANYTLPSGDDELSITINEVVSSQIIGDTLIDFGFQEGGAIGIGFDFKERSGFLGYDITSDQIELYNEDSELLWEYDLGATPANTPVIRQASHERAIVQVDSELYVLDITDIFNITGDESDSAPELSAGSQIEKLFSAPLSTSLNGVNVEASGSEKYFLVKDDNDILRYTESTDNTRMDTLYENTGPLLDLDFIVTESNTAFIIKQLSETNYILSKFDPDSTTEETMLSAEYIEFITQDDNVYINTLNASGFDGWQAHWFNDDLAQVTYDDQQFIFLDDHRERNYALYLTAEVEVEEEAVTTTKVALFKYDSSEINGRLKETLSSSESNRRDPGDFIIGYFNESYEYTNDNKITNDIYGYILSGSNRYYFDPTDLRNESLALIP